MKKQKIENKLTINDLCDDAICAILARLPPKTLVRLTCVSKSWNSLIRSPTFMIKYRKESYRSRYLLYIPEDPFLTSTLVTESSTRQRLNLKMPFYSFKVVGCCQGLISVVNSYSQICLWNPLLEITRILPSSPSHGTEPKRLLGEETYSVYGLGYSCKNDDYRVVKITYESAISSSLISNRVEMYSLKSNSWKSIDCVAPLVAGGKAGVFMNGCINWVAAPTPTFAKEGAWTMIVWFDIDKELFGKRDLAMKPQLSHKSQKAAAYVKEVLGRAEYDDNKKQGSLWKSKALACENSWVKLRLNNIKVEKVTTFDGDIFLRTECDDMFRLLGFSVDKTLLEEEERGILKQRFRIVCVPESLVLFNRRSMNTYVASV